MSEEDPVLRRRREAGERALAEAEARRKATEAITNFMPLEIGRQSGPEPTRYGDWECKGRVSDF